MDPIGDLAERLTQLEAKVRALEAGDIGEALEVHELRARRLVIVDGSGEDRVVIGTVASTASVMVRLPGSLGATTGIEMFASPSADGVEPTVGWCVLSEGDVAELWPPGS